MPDIPVFVPGLQVGLQVTSIGCHPCGNRRLNLPNLLVLLFRIKEDQAKRGRTERHGRSIHCEILHLRVTAYVLLCHFQGFYGPGLITDQICTFLLSKGINLFSRKLNKNVFKNLYVLTYVHMYRIPLWPIAGENFRQSFQF